MSRTASAVGKVRIDFELDCDGPCVFIMFTVSYFRERQLKGLLNMTQNQYSCEKSINQRSAECRGCSLDTAVSSHRKS